MPAGILLALFAYASLAWGDALVKALAGRQSVFEIAFFTTLFAAVTIWPTRNDGERWRHFWRMKRPWAVQARALSGILAGVLGVYAFTTIPLAEAYALIFLSPLFVTILSALVLKEEIGPWRWAAVLLGFVGVMMVVKPGFQTLGLGHLAATAVAFLAGITIILLRSLAREEKRTSILGVMILYGVLFNGAGMLVVDGLAVPTLEELAILASSGLFAGLGQIALLAATRLVPANQIAPTHYSQIAWAVVIGAVFFAEYPDLMTVVGLGVLAFAGLLTLVRERIRLGRVRWNPFFRNRL